MEIFPVAIVGCVTNVPLLVTPSGLTPNPDRATVVVPSGHLPPAPE